MRTASGSASSGWACAPRSAATSWSASAPRRSPAGESDDDVLELPVVLSEMLGSDVLLHLDTPTSSALTADMLDAGEELVDNPRRFIARVPPNVRPAPGERVRLRVDLTRVHLFDPETERFIRRCPPPHAGPRVSPETRRPAQDVPSSPSGR